MLTAGVMACIVSVWFIPNIDPNPSQIVDLKNPQRNPE